MIQKTAFQRILIVSLIFLFVGSGLMAGTGIFESESFTRMSVKTEAERKSTRAKYTVDDVKAAIEKGLEFLNESQAPDGGWADDRYGKNCNTAGNCLRAFVDYNATDPRWQTAIEGVVRFMRYVWHDPADYSPGSDRDRNGGMLNNDRFAPPYTHGSMYSHGAATASLIDYFFHTQDIALLPYINASVEMIIRAQNTPQKPSTLGGPRSQGGWRYEPHTTSSDTSLSGWNIHAIVLAESSGIYDVPDYAFEYAEKWLDHCSSGSGFGYSGAYTSNTNTAVGTYCMYLLGKPDKASTRGGTNSLLNWGPTYQISRHYYTYHATIAMYLHGERNGGTGTRGFRPVFWTPRGMTGAGAGATARAGVLPWPSTRSTSALANRTRCRSILRRIPRRERTSPWSSSWSPNTR